MISYLYAVRSKELLHDLDPLEPDDDDDDNVVALTFYDEDLVVQATKLYYPIPSHPLYTLARNQVGFCIADITDIDYPFHDTKVVLRGVVDMYESGVEKRLFYDDLIAFGDEGRGKFTAMLQTVITKFKMHGSDISEDIFAEMNNNVLNPLKPWRQEALFS